MYLIKLLFISLLMAIISVSDCGRSSDFRQGKVIEIWETANNTFKVRATAYKEKDIFPTLAGAYYVFESAAVNSENWGKIMTFRHDDPIAIPREQVRFVNNQIGYVFMGWMYAVTIDSGSTWSIWNAEKDLPNWQCCNYRLIRDVRIEPDGTGVMMLKPIPRRQGEVPKLHTRDYGQHWSVE